MDQLLHGVFEIEGAKDTLRDEPRTVAYVAYVRLVGGLSRGSAIARLRATLAEKYHVSTAAVSFKFWCDGWAAGGGCPLELGPKK